MFCWRTTPCAACDLTATKRPRGRDYAKLNKQLTNKAHTYHEEYNDIYKTSTLTKPTRQRVHSDVKTMPRSIRSYKYFAVFVHEPSRHLKVELLNQSEVPLKVKAYMKFAQSKEEFPL